MTAAVLEVKNLSKHFGTKKAVDNVDFVVNKGNIFGLLGPNGSGKTTTLSSILTLLKPTSGAISLFGSDDLEQGLRRMGVLLESSSYYPELSAKNNLRISCRIKNVDESRIDAVLEKTNLIADKKTKIKKFSLGMKQRLAVASVLLSDPELLIFDEPTNGLDPQGIADIRQLILDLGKEGKTILVASHLLNEMEKVCTHVAIMKNGKILSSGELKSLINGHASLEEYFLATTK